MIRPAPITGPPPDRLPSNSTEKLKQKQVGCASIWRGLFVRIARRREKRSADIAIAVSALLSPSAQRIGFPKCHRYLARAVGLDAVSQGPGSVVCGSEFTAAEHSVQHMAAHNNRSLGFKDRQDFKLMR